MLSQYTKNARKFFYQCPVGLHVWVKHESSHRGILYAAGVCQQGNEPKVRETHGNLPASNQTPAIITVNTVYVYNRMFYPSNDGECSQIGPFIII